MSSTPSLPGERRPVTILFTDIAGSTAIAERLDPEEWKEIVLGAHRIVGETVRRYEGTVAQYLGDGVLAFFGAPVTHEDDPLRAVRSALEIQRQLEGYRLELRGLVQDFQMRIGIHSGTVVVGQVGDAGHMEYLAIGDAVNLAARLQSAAEPGGVLVSDAIARPARQAFELADLGEISVKGKSDVVHVYRVVRELETPLRRGGQPGLVSPLVGRESELGVLQGALEQLEHGRGGIVFILGEAGIGKTRLVEEARCASPESVRWLEGRSLSYGAALSFWPVRQLVLDDLELSDGDPQVRVRVALNRRLEQLAGERWDDQLPYLYHLLGLRQEPEIAERLTRLGAEALRLQVLLAITAHFSALATKSPLVLVFEDLHWADASSLEALERLFPAATQLPLLLVCLARLVRGHGAWRLMQDARVDYPGCFSEIDLGQLSSMDSERMVGELLNSEGLSEQLTSQVLELADGNPFFIEEILSSLIERGVLEKRAGGWAAISSVGPIEMPNTIQGVLLSRIDSLPVDVRQTLQLAAVIGRSFLYRLLKAVSQDGQGLDWQLVQLQRSDLIHELSPLPELEYIFKHSLTQEAAYASVLLEQRREYHRRVAQALEELFAERGAEYSAFLAHHYDLGDEKRKAADYYQQAGDRARLEYAFEEALRCYRRLTELQSRLDDPEAESRTWLKLGLVYQSDFAFGEAHKAYEKAFALRQSIPARMPAAKEPRRPHVFRIGGFWDEPPELDPGRGSVTYEGEFEMALFAGLVEYDPESNAVPHLARSWEVLEGGRRYIFHLRDDVFWSDGARVTASDFDWGWKRNLQPSKREYPASLLDDVRGARSYRLGQDADPAHVGVRALDPLTLEVELEEPVAYFIYLMANPVSFPLPAHVVRRSGEGWWKPPHGVYNGAFKLVEYTDKHGVIVRNPGYFGSTPGDLDRIEWEMVDPAKMMDLESRFLGGDLEMCNGTITREMSQNIPPEFHHTRPGLVTLSLVFDPLFPPTDDLRVRQALACGIDFGLIASALFHQEAHTYQGGLVPPGMIGHSPDLKLSHDLKSARRLLSEAGYPGGQGLPTLKLRTFANNPAVEGLQVQLRQDLGIEVEQVVISNKPVTQQDHNSNMRLLGWSADYPDPDNFLRQSSVIYSLHQDGWLDERYERLVEQAAHSSDRVQRAALYREADRMLVCEQVLVAPVSASNRLFLDLYRPEIEPLAIDALGFLQLKHVRLT